MNPTPNVPELPVKNKTEKGEKMRDFSCMFLLSHLLGVTSCGEKPLTLTGVPAIDGEYAFAMAEKSVSFRNRVSGSKEIALYGDWIEKESGGSSRRFYTKDTPIGKVHFRNIEVIIPGKKKEFLVIGAHYDTKRFSSFQFDGANDGGSGVGALLAMIKVLREKKIVPPYTLHFVFFDGEECMEEYGVNDGLHGSRHYVVVNKKSGRLANCKGMILLDMIGDKDLKIAPGSECTPALVKRLLLLAEKTGKKEFAGTFPGEILDDHVPFLKAGIPAIDLIDFSYGPNNLYWHTEMDTLDKISGQSIKTAADLAFLLIWNFPY